MIDFKDENNTDEAEEGDSRPTQEDINEGICLDERPVHVRLGFLGEVTTDGVVAFYERKIVASAGSTRALFKALRDLRVSLGSPRIFMVNDHGNVTEYAYSGRVLGEWV